MLKMRRCTMVPLLLARLAGGGSGCCEQAYADDALEVADHQARTQALQAAWLHAAHNASAVAIATRLADWHLRMRQQHTTRCKIVCQCQQQCLW
jgi:hypothetical protein